jgi:RimJ/RimL family protein N-acetyltransferase
MLRFAFEELNLHRLEAIIPEYNPIALRLFSKAGMRPDPARQRSLFEKELRPEQALGAQAA